MKIHYGCITQNEIEDLVPNIESLLPHVDSVTVCDGGSNPNTFMYMRNWSLEEPKIRFFLHPWRDDFPWARNNLLTRINEIAQTDDWICTTDPDEFIQQPESLKHYILIAQQHNKNMIGFQCRSVSLKGKKRVWENLDDYWKRFLIKWDRNMRYAAHGGQVHEYITGIDHRIWDPGSPGSTQPALIYEHRKQENIIWLRGLRNFYCGGGGPNGNHTHIHEWKEFKHLADYAIGNLNTPWHDFYKYFIKGNISPEIKNWMINHRNDDWGDGSSEFREAYKTYFILLHPEEMPPELKGEYIP